jgi:hypothetical protein
MVYHLLQRVLIVTITKTEAQYQNQSGDDSEQE